MAESSISEIRGKKPAGTLASLPALKMPENSRAGWEPLFRASKKTSLNGTLL
jgi:hypothetical protein